MKGYSDVHTGSAIDASMIRLCLMGSSPDVGNMGCRALTASLVRLLLEAGENLHISILGGVMSDGTRSIRLSANREVTVEAISYRLALRAGIRRNLLFILFLSLLWRFLPVKHLRDMICKISPWLHRLNAAAWAGDINGGDSFSDIYGTTRFLENATPMIIAIAMRKPLILLPQTYGPYNSIIAQHIARLILNKSPIIYARDAQSIKVVQDLIGPPETAAKVQLSPDVAFRLEPIEPPHVDIRPRIPEGISKMTVGLNVSGLLWIGGLNRNNMFGLKSDYRSLISELAKRLCADMEAQVVLFPHTMGSAEASDQPACRELFAKLTTEGVVHIHLLEGTYDAHELKAIIAKFDFLIASRMHACIAALSQAVPCVAIAYSRKFAGVFETVDSADLVLDARKMDKEQILDACCRMIRERNDLAMRLARRSNAVVRQLNDIFHELVPQTVTNSGPSTDTLRDVVAGSCARHDHAGSK